MMFAFFHSVVVGAAVPHIFMSWSGIFFVFNFLLSLSRVKKAGRKYENIFSLRQLFSRKEDMIEINWISFLRNTRNDELCSLLSSDISVGKNDDDGKEEKKKSRRNYHKIFAMFLWNFSWVVFFWVGKLIFYEKSVLNSLMMIMMMIYRLHAIWNFYYTQKFTSEWRKNYENHSQTPATPIKDGRMKFDYSRRPHEKMLIF